MKNSMNYFQLELTKFLSPSEQKQFDLYIETYNRWAESFNRTVVDILDEVELILPGDYQRVMNFIIVDGMGNLDNNLKSLNSIIELNEVIA